MAKMRRNFDSFALRRFKEIRHGRAAIFRRYEFRFQRGLIAIRRGMSVTNADKIMADAIGRAIIRAIMNAGRSRNRKRRKLADESRTIPMTAEDIVAIEKARNPRGSGTIIDGIRRSKLRNRSTVEHDHPIADRQGLGIVAGDV